MATINIYGPSSHSQTVVAPGTIVAVASVTNYGNGWGYARMRITGTTSGTGSLVSIRPGVSLNVRATAPISTGMEGRTFTVSAHLEEMDSGYNRIRGIDSHYNFSITVERPYVPPYIPPWHWEEEEEQDDTTGPVNGPVNGPPDSGVSEPEPEAPPGEDISDFEGGDYPDYEPETDWDTFDDDQWFGG